MLTEHQPNQVIEERYQILNILGKGSVGITYSAITLATQEKVAIKAVSLRQLKDWKQVELLEREAKTLMQLDHVAIPQYLEYFQVDSQKDRVFYIAQQLAPGKSLGELVESGWRTTEAQVKEITTQILDILIYLHSQKPPIIHRDVKPHNLILSEEGKVYLVDFGAVQNTYYNTLMRGSTVVGTYGYMAPEQFQGKAQSQTDLYGLGATILCLLTHRSPAELPHDNLAIDFRDSVNISEDFAIWLETMLQPDLEARFSSAKVAKDALHSGKLSLSNTKNKAKVLSSLALAGVIAITSVVLVLNPYRWAILSHLGIAPQRLSEDIEVMKNYFHSGGDANVKNKKGQTPLHTTWSSEIAEMLLTHGADVNAKDNKKGQTPLHTASHSGRVKLLLAYGADVNAKDKLGQTPLHTAWNSEIAEVLIAHGADVNVKDKLGQTPLHTACVVSDFPLDGDIRHYKVKLAEILLAHGADVNAKDKYGRTPLHTTWNPKIAEMLLAHGANVNAKDQLGQTPLHTAWNLEEAEILLAHGADVNAKDKYGAKPYADGWR